MLFRIVRPMKRSTSSHAYFVQRIPSDIKARAPGFTLRIPIGDSIVEKVISPNANDVRFSLRTRDPSEAKLRQATAAAYLERVWQSLRQGPVRLLQGQVVALSGEIFHSFRRAFEQEPGTPERWQRFRAEIAEAKRARLPGANDPYAEGSDDARALAMEKRFGRTADELLTRKGLVIDEDTRSRLLEAIAKAEDDAAAVLDRRAEGDFTPDNTASRFPQWVPPASAPSAAPNSSASTSENGQSLTGLLAGWWKEAQATGLSPRTYDSYRATVERLVAFIGHDNADAVTPEDIVRYKDHRLAFVHPRTKKKISAKTVKDSDLAGLKAVFGWAMTNRKLPSNPASGITVKVPPKVKTRSAGFTDEEAKNLLAKALAYRSEKEAPKRRAAKRWVAWVCAYTGARVGEIIQLRKQDLRKEGEYWVITITPDAGTVKTGGYRDVPLHADLIQQGFPEFVQEAPPGFLFFDAKRNGEWRGPAKDLANKLREFVREVVPDPRLQPFHAWRHRFKTICREVGIAEQIADAIQGHSSNSVSARYGEVTIRAMARELAKFPRQSGG